MTVSEAPFPAAESGARQGPRLRHASFESRVVAGILDGLMLFIIAALFVTAGSMVILISSDFEKVEPSTTAINIFWGAALTIPIAFLLYFFIGWAWRGQTVGAAVMQVRVVKSNGRRLGILGSLARVLGLLAYVVVIAIGCFIAFAYKDSTLIAAAAIGIALILAVAGLVWAAFDRHRRTLHDRLAGTIVVRVE